MFIGLSHLCHCFYVNRGRATIQVFAAAHQLAQRPLHMPGQARPCFREFQASCLLNQGEGEAGQQ